jgi:hypothetical protein
MAGHVYRRPLAAVRHSVPVTCGRDQELRVPIWNALSKSATPATWSFGLFGANLRVEEASQMHPGLTSLEDLTKGAPPSGLLRGWMADCRRPVVR